MSNIMKTQAVEGLLFEGAVDSGESIVDHNVVLDDSVMQEFFSQCKQN